jgi:hypothetical protein
MAKTKKPDQCGNCQFSQDTGKESYDVRIFDCCRFPAKETKKETEWCGEHKPEIKKEKSGGKEKES